MNRHKTEKKFLEHGIIDESAMLAYLNNEITADEKQQFEKLLKDDPFAQEALEGLQSAQSKTTASEAITSINRKVRERTGLKEKQPLRIHWSNYAWAAVLLGLLIGVGGVMITYMDKHDDNIAMNKEAGEETKETGLFENKQELKSTESPMVAATDSLSVSQQLTTTDATANSTKGKETPETLRGADEKEIATGKSKDIPTAVTTPSSSAAGTSFNGIVAVTEKNSEGTAAPAAKSANDESRNTTATRADDVKQESKKSTTITTTQKVMRGGVMEREEADKVTVITMDDAMQNFNSGKYKESSEQFDAILQQQPANADALYFGGISDYINGNARKSEKNFDRLLKEGTKFVDGSKWYKANILLQRGKRDEAQKLLEELSQSNGSYKERAIKKKADAGL